jgi:Zn-dependent protease with chaperone function
MGIHQRTRVSRTAREAMFLFARAGAVVAVVFYWKSRDSTDAREVLLVPLAVFWTVVAVAVIWAVDGFVRSVCARVTTSEPPLSRAVPRRHELSRQARAAGIPEHVWRQRERLL